MEFVEMSVTSHNEEETKKTGYALAKILQAGDCVALFGDLGSGKTVFTKGIAEGIRVLQEVTSPTFTLMNEYEGENVILRHFDMYRIKGEEELYDIGYFDSLRAPYLAVIEWSENIEEFLSPEAILVFFQKTDESSRELKIRIDRKSVV